MNITYILFSAILTSALHVISGPDHLAAVTPLVSETNYQSWKIGLFWGLGHVVGMLLIGAFFLVFKELLPVNTISKHSEKLVASILIGVGIWAFYKLFSEEKEYKQALLDSEKKGFTYVRRNHEQIPQRRIQQSVISSLGIGAIHGVAGFTHFLLLLPVLTLNTQFEGFIYIFGFAVGTILSMTVYTSMLSRVVSYVRQEYSVVFFKGIRFAGGLFALTVGIYWLYLEF